MCKVETDILLKTDGNIPIELVKTLSNWQDILLNNLPFLITICIISLAAFVTYKSNRASIASQNELAIKARQEEQENQISEFRHQWLQEVRETSSKLIQIIHDCQYYTKSWNLSQEQVKKNTADTNVESQKSLLKALESSFDTIIQKRSEFYKYEAKLKLLFKKDEEETKKLFEIIESIKATIGQPETTSLDDEKIDEIISELQIVLKTEWEATKNRTWIKDT
jgi:hypothetical protein